MAFLLAVFEAIAVQKNVHGLVLDKRQNPVMNKISDTIN